MPRGRPPRNKADKKDSKYVKISSKNTKRPKGSENSILKQELDQDDEITEAPRQKRKYTKRRKMEQNMPKKTLCKIWERQAKHQNFGE